ncbi:MAG: cell division protein FtsZ [Treponema sp.]
MEIEVISDHGSGLNEISPTVIKIIGCGGGGSSAVGRMIEAGVTDVQFIVLNTDLQALNKSPAQNKLAIGQKLTGGLGAGGNPAVGENAAKEDIEKIKNIVKGADMVIITAGMGGGTGTGSAPIVAQIARAEGALSIAVVTTPFDFEGTVRMRYAQDGITKLKEQVDSLIVIPNEQVLKTCDNNVTFKDAFLKADSVLCQGVQGLSDIITKTGAVNIDFADVRTVMNGQGEAILGVGSGEGENRAVDAASRAINNPLLENRQIDGARNILINITSSDDLSMKEVNDIVNTIKASASKENQIFWGQVINQEMEGRVSVTVIATGFDPDVKSAVKASSGEPKKDVPPVQAARTVREETNVYSNAEFDMLLQGKNPAETEPPQRRVVPPAARPAPVASSPAANETSQQVQPRELKPEQYGSMEAPNYDPSDLSIPAVMRQQRDGLSRTINFNRN